MQEAERGPMKKDWEIYRDTGILGGYIPEQAKLRRTEDGEVATVFRDTVTHEEEDCIAKPVSYTHLTLPTTVPV